MAKKSLWEKFVDLKSRPLCFEDDEVVDFGKHSISSAKEQQFSPIGKKCYISHKISSSSNDDKIIYSFMKKNSVKLLNMIYQNAKKFHEKNGILGVSFFPPSDYIYLLLST